jgi:glycosyltransferase involved in cell wall biosynthesis
MGAEVGEAATNGGVVVAGRPLKVGVLVDLTLSAEAGGHVKCWQRIAEAAVGFADRLDLTVHFNGRGQQQVELSPTVRYALLPPVLSTERLVREVPDHTDIAPWHPRLARALGDYDVIHTTDAFFCYASTATRFARRHGTPIVSSIHTNTPEYARITAKQWLQRRLGNGLAYRAVNDVLALPDRVSAVLERRLANHLARVTSAMGSYGGEFDARYRDRHCGVSLRRGLDRAVFNPTRRDRAWFESRFGLMPGYFVVMYAGKLNAGKNVPVLEPIVERARQAGMRVHLLCAGSGPEQAALQVALGPVLTCSGTLDQDELARAYASADLFLFPSMIDESGNAAVEALACGLPALLAAGSGVASRMADCAGLRVLPGDRPELWAAAITELAAAPTHLAAMRMMAHDYTEEHVPSWGDILAEDLLPVWQAAAGAPA